MKTMTARELKDLFVNFFVAKGHVEIPSASLVPENDSTTLFVSAGMQPLVPFLLGQPHSQGKRLVNVQKSLRTQDIEEVGDNCHHTFFEMLGNWSLGDYFKETMIPWSYEFLTQHLHYKHEQIHVTCFAGDTDAPKDVESHDLWRSVGVPEDRIYFLSKKDNWWGPAGITGPCGPDSEMFIDTHAELGPIQLTSGDNRGRIVEIGNDVFMQFNKTTDGKFELLSQKNVDTGYGVERNLAIYLGFDDDYLTSIWQPIIKKIEEISGKPYHGNEFPMRIIADHLRSAVFVIADGIEPSNKERGYVLRRLIRRSIRQGKLLGVESNFTSIIAQAVLDNQNNFAGIYPELDQNKDKILAILDSEENKFRKTLNNGLREIQKLIDRNKSVSGQEAFTLYESFGFPVEMIEEELKKHNLILNREEFDKAKIAHIEQSRTLSAGKFKSGLADNSEIITKYHTATHLLHAALRQILGTHVEQSGSNITSERLRFDFSHSDKITAEQLTAIENLINQKISENLVVSREEKPKEQALSEGALAFFGQKYPDIVSVYSIGSPEDPFSKELCGGPHVTNTRELAKIKIVKQESLGANDRRLYLQFV